MYTQLVPCRLSPPSLGHFSHDFTLHPLQICSFIFREPQVRPEMEASHFPGTQAAHLLPGLRTPEDGGVCVRKPTPRRLFLSFLSWLQAGGGAAHLLLLQYSLLDCWQREQPSSRDQQPVCLKGSLLLLNAILTDESEPIIAKNSSGCRGFFQVAAWPIQRTFALVAKGQLSALGYLPESPNQLRRGLLPGKKGLQGLGPKP